MLRILLGSLLYVLAALSLSAGQNNPYWQDIYLVGTMTPTMSDEVDVTILASGESQGCSTWNKPADALCSGFVSRGATAARIEIRARGYKTYTINIPTLTFDKDTAKINIGTVALTKSDLPTVQQVLASRTKDGGRRVFELTLLNRLSRDVLITGLRVRASHPGNGRTCCCPPLAIYDIANDLTIVGGGKGTLSAAGEYQERSHGQDHIVAVTSSIETFTCDDSTKLELTLPVSFVIPKDSYSAIQVIVPEKFTIKGSRFQFFEKVRDANVKPKVGPDTGQLSQFEEFEFTLSTGEKDELNIEAAYPSEDARARSR